MADILIRGIKVPEDCDSCIFGVDKMFDKYCPLSDNYYDWDESSEGSRPKDCPLVHLPENHGRLIDADALYERAASLDAQALDYVAKLIERDGDEISTEWKIWSAILAERTAFKHDVFDAPTIIPAEGGPDNGK